MLSIDTTLWGGTWVAITLLQRSNTILLLLRTMANFRYFCGTRTGPLDLFWHQIPNQAIRKLLKTLKSYKRNFLIKNQQTPGWNVSLPKSRTECRSPKQWLLPDKKSFPAKLHKGKTTWAETLQLHCGNKMVPFLMENIQQIIDVIWVIWQLSKSAVYPLQIYNMKALPRLVTLYT